MTENTYPFVLIDGSSYFYRAFHALPPLANSKGQPTGAVYGVLNMIRRLIKDYQPQYLAVVFDAKGKTFRDDIYPEYKANRPPMPDELSMQFEPLVDIINALGIPILNVPGVEADDVIGTLAQQAQAAGTHVLISTGDKDMAQLVNEHVTLINTMNGKLFDIDGVIEKFGVRPDQIIDYLSLIGDKVDNVPGVDKVGPKTAVKWLTQYENLDNLMQHADEVGGKVGENLRQSCDRLPLSRELITIKCDVELELDFHKLIPASADKPKLIELYRQMEFRSWLDALLSSEDDDNANNSNYVTILDEATWQQWFNRLQAADAFAFDSETTSLNTWDAEIVGLSFAIKAGEAAYIPLAHDYPDAPAQLSRAHILQQLKPLLEDEQRKKIGQNLKYDANVLKNYDIDLRGIYNDTMLNSYVLNSSANRHDMDSLALKYLGKKTIHFEEIAGKGKKQKRFDEIDIEIASQYAAEDADISLQLHQQLWPKVCAEDGLQKVLTNIEIPLSRVLARMERDGVLVDCDKLHEQSKAIAKRISQLEHEIYELAGEKFNINSTKQLQHILFEKLQLPIIKKTPKGQPSTAEAVLHELAYDYALPKLLTEYRQLTKLQSTYLEALPHYVQAKTGRIHTSYNQAVTATGRLSSTEPNLQNIPIRTTEGQKIREAFIAPSGYRMVAADYSQVELRIMAQLSQDDNLLKAFSNGWDIHSATAAEVFSVDLKEVTPEMRRHSKAINFGLIYGMSAFGLAKQIDASREEAQDYIDRYFTRYPGVKAYMDNTRELAHQQGYVETLYGRRLYLPDINARNLMRQKAAERTAINAPMQGTAADIIKLAMLRIDDYLQHSDVDAKMIMQVHDELVFEVADSDVDRFIPQLRQLMCDITELNVPLAVDIGQGDNWQQAH